MKQNATCPIYILYRIARLAYAAKVRKKVEKEQVQKKS